MPTWNDLSEIFGLDVVNYFKELGEQIPITRFVPRRCHSCGSHSSSLSPDGSGDWWFFCSSCKASWNLFEHLRRTNGFSEDLAIDWLVSAQVLDRDDAVRYAKLSNKKSFVIEWLKNMQLKNERPQTDIPGELFCCHVSDIMEVLRGLEMDLSIWNPSMRFFEGSVFRSIYGVPCEISFVQDHTVKQIAQFKITLSKDQQVFKFVDGIVGGSPLYLASPEFLSESEGLPTQRPLAIVSQHIRSMIRFYSPPAHIDFRLLSSDGRVTRDLIGAPFILESSASKVVIGSVETPVDEVLMDGDWWRGITGFALGKGVISRSALYRIACLGAVKTNDSVSKVEEVIRSCSKGISEVIRSSTITPSPFGMISRDHNEKSGPRITPSGVVANFNIAWLSSKKSGDSVRLSLTLDGKRAIVSVPLSVANDSNLLITELHAAARENNMGALVVYRRPPYIKNLFYK
jgi:hypothetical protein